MRTRPDPNKRYIDSEWNKKLRRIFDFCFVLNIVLFNISTQRMMKKKWIGVVPSFPIFQQKFFFSFHSGSVKLRSFLLCKSGIYTMINCTCVSWLNINAWFRFFSFIGFRTTTKMFKSNQNRFFQHLMHFALYLKWIRFQSGNDSFFSIQKKIKTGKWMPSFPIHCVPFGIE